MSNLQYLARKYLNVVPLILLFFLIITYWRVPFIFFLQDEWQTFGLVISEGAALVLRGLGDNKILHFIPLDNLLNYLSYTIFNLHYSLYSIVGLSIHFINGLLVFELGRKIFKNQSIAIAAGIIFIASSISNQLIMWPVVSLNTSSLTFSLLAWVMLLHFSHINKFKLGIGISALILLALFTLEYSIGLLAFIPLVGILLFYKKDEAENLLIMLLPIFVLVLLYTGLRFYPVVLHQGTQVTKQVSEVDTLFYKAIRYPFRYIGQAFVPQTLIQDVSRLLSTDNGRPAEFFFSKVTFTLGIFFTILFSLLGWIIEYKLKEKYFFRNELILLLFFFCSSAPFLLIPGEAGNFTLYPPRYLYFGLVSASLLSASLLSLLKMKIKSVTVLILTILLLGIVYNIWGNWVKSNDLYEESMVRLSILNTIKNQYPTLPGKVIFLTESSSSYYGLSDDKRILPFQSGFGQTLLVWYQSREKFPDKFFADKFLWNITDQGYLESGTRGFGYYWNFENMAEAIQKNGLNLSSVIAYSFDSRLNELTDITTQVKQRLTGFKAKKALIPQTSFVSTSPDNGEEISFLKDGNRSTFWDSKLTYINPQYLIIDLRSERKVAQISIDSFNNKDQDKVGYKISFSNNGTDYIPAFNSKIYPPDNRGMVNLYFQPQQTRFIKIDQQGRHEFATWVIHELNIYESVE
ncbi:MAG: discoidin domain-containing protein [Candidatus Daviesbacteria bacterium]|nr:discoidin domain-containing protein [Candidatus Daviesbacteria bacterium]